MARSAGLSQTAYNALMEAYKRHGTITGAAQECGIHARSAREYVRGIYKPAPDTNPDAGIIIENLRKELQTTRDALTAAKRPRYTVRADNIARGEKSLLPLSVTHTIALTSLTSLGSSGLANTLKKPNQILSFRLATLPRLIVSRRTRATTPSRAKANQKL